MVCRKDVTRNLSFCSLLGGVDLFVLVSFVRCGHCQRLAPTWAKLAAHFKDDEVVHIAKVDCTEEKDLCAQNDVGGYPTLFLFQDGNVIQRYTGGRSLDEMITFVNEHKPHPGIPQADGMVSTCC